MALEIVVMSPQRLLFQGSGQHVTLPGEQGVFEVEVYHRPLMSRLLPGLIVVDGQVFPIHRGVVKIEHDTVTAIVDEDA